MKKFKKFLKWFFIVLILFVGGTAIYVKTFLPNVPLLEDIKAPTDSASLARGKYLANHVMVCVDCHSQRDWTKFSGPLVAGTEGQGGELFDQKFGFPGKFISRNITPFALKNWSDAEIFRAITSGVNKEGKALFPVMPYHNYGRTSKEDVLCVIAYIKTLNEIKKENEASSADFPMSFIINTIPAKAEFINKPPQGTFDNGKYIATLASCIDCHTQFEKGQLKMDLAYAGGREFPMPDGSLLRSPNLTPDKETGIGNWSESAFVSRFKTYASSKGYQHQSVKPGQFNSIMPWTMYAEMDSLDLVDLFSYLKTLKPISNKVEKYSAAVTK